MGIVIGRSRHLAGFLNRGPEERSKRMGNILGLDGGACVVVSCVAEINGTDLWPAGRALLHNL